MMRKVCIGSLILVLSPLVPMEARARDVTFEERVRAQEAIERLYYSHQIGATRPFEEALPREILEQKVIDHLRMSRALEEIWRTPVTAEMLERETERMVRRTRSPERLRQLFAALGDDPLLVQECLARPLLVERLSRNFFAFDERFHAAAREEADRLRGEMLRRGVEAFRGDPRRSEVEISAARPAMVGPPQPGPARRTVEVSPQGYESWRASAPGRIGEIGPVREERGAFAIRVVLAEERQRARLATFTVGKRTWDDWWEETAPALDPWSAVTVASGALRLPPVEPAGSGGLGRDRLDGGVALSGSSAPGTLCLPDDTWVDVSLGDLPTARENHTAVWTGSEMIIWGGWAGGFADTGGRYDPATDTWIPTSTSGAPAGRRTHSVVWTGNEMIVWGGDARGATNSGGRYDPATDTWTPTSTIGSPSGRLNHSAVWTGSEMIVWGGDAGGATDTGSRYDPASDTWMPISTMEAPTGREGHTALWTGSEMVVWGGTILGDFTATGGRYDPAYDIWSSVSATGAPIDLRRRHTAVWTGSAMLVWGGDRGGGRYDPAIDVWNPLSKAGAPDGDGDAHSAVWTGDAMIVWDLEYRSGGRYDPDADAWTPGTTIGAPEFRWSHTAVWTGHEMVVWGGQGNVSDLNTGGRYNPVADNWTPTSRPGAPSERTGHTAVWTGNEMIVWGGQTFGNDPVNTGGRYDPATENWRETATAGAPSARDLHTAVWDGSSMIVWGGGPYGGVLGTGGRYDPVTDGWTPTSATGAPAGRSEHTAIWTGSRMIVWGGRGGVGDLDTGGSYDPTADSWTILATMGAPTGRHAHTAVWTGSRMIIWGGRDGAGDLGSGGSYDPAQDNWTTLSTTGAPTGPAGQTAVWTGNELIIWGGVPDEDTPGTGSRYDPDADAWTPTSTVMAPTGRIGHSAVWTGDDMIVWGGINPPPTNTGGRYDPAADTWSPTSTTGAPVGRPNHSAVWTGGAMIVWGGYYSGDRHNTGGLYALGLGGDDDGDGLSECSGDCNDGDPMVHPGAAEICNGRDDDCDGVVDDGSGVPCNDPPTGVIDALPQIECTSPDGAVATLDGSRSSDPNSTPGTNDDIVSFEWYEEFDTAPAELLGTGETLPVGLSLGDHVITLRVADGQGETGFDEATVTIEDTTSPEITAGLDVPLLWPPNHRMVDVSAAIAASDLCGTPSVTLDAVTSSEPDDADGAGDGGTIDDIQGIAIGSADLQFQLRAERSGSGGGRFYTATYRALDGSDNAEIATVMAYVPHDVGGTTEPMTLVAFESGSGTLIQWLEVSGALSYNVVRGEVSSIQEREESIHLGPLECIAAGTSLTNTLGAEDPENPALGEAFFYLVEYNDGLPSGYGTESAAKDRFAPPGQAACHSP